MEREGYEQVTALIGAIAKALDLSEAEATRAVEDGRVALSMGSDERGERYVEAQGNGRRARIYQGAILHAPSAAGETAAGGCRCGS